MSPDRPCRELGRERKVARQLQRLSPSPWPAIAHPAQRPPEGGWRTWLFMGGRGAGKTRAGAEWVHAVIAASADSRPAPRIALVGPTLSDVREVMIEGPGGLVPNAPPHNRPAYQPSRRRLVWPSGALGFAFSAEDPDSLRGPQFDLAWCDEIAAWPRGEAVWDMLAFALRLGRDPRVMASTTPRPVALVRRLLKLEETGAVAVTRASTHANAAALAPGFIAALEARYGGSHLARQELWGELVEDPAGAMFRRAVIDEHRASPGEIPAAFDRIVVAVDPPVSTGPDADACGIVVAGRTGTTAWVLEDATVQGLAPSDWAARVIAASDRWGAGRIVAESNQGGDLIRQVLVAAGAGRLAARVFLRRAVRSKLDRAEPVSALYSAGRVRHAGLFRDLEDEMCAFGAGGAPAGKSPAGRSPDRVDALVWALNDLLVPTGLPPRVIVL